MHEVTIGVNIFPRMSCLQHVLFVFMIYNFKLFACSLLIQDVVFGESILAGDSSHDL